MLRRLIASVTLTAVASAGCGGRAWPSAAATVADPAFAARSHQIATVDVLPLDLAVWTEAGVAVNPAELRTRAESRIMNTALDALTRRAYGIDAVIDWNGEAAGTVALARPDLLATIAALARYGEAVEQQPGALPTPALPARLGASTGADATLYVGGWAYVAAHRESTGSKVAKGVAIALVAVALIGVVVAIAAASKDSDSSSSSSAKKSGGSKQRAGGAAVRDHREEAIAEIRDHRSTMPATPDHRTASAEVRDHRGSTVVISDDHDSVGPPSVRDHRSGSPDTPTVRDHRSTDAPTLRDHRRPSDVAVDLSWMTEADTELELDPSWRAQEATPDLGKDSQLYLEMTLVDNRTGLVLWHAHQAFPANVAKPANTERAVRLLLASLPSRAR